MSQKPEDLLVTLANGTQVPWSVFRTWSARKQSCSLIERKYSDETRAKLSAARKGAMQTQESRLISKLANLGKTQSAEHRAKRSAALKGRPKSPEHVAKIQQVKKRNKINATICQKDTK